MSGADGVIGFNTTSGGSKSYQVYAGPADSTVSIKFTFDAPINSFGTFVTGFDTRSSLANLGKIHWTNSLGAQSVSFTNTLGLNNAQYLGFVDEGELFSEVTLTFNEVAGSPLRDTLQIDDVSYGVAVVPEPLSMVVLGAGMVAFTRRRR